MADTDFNYNDLPPLVPKGKDRKQIIAGLVEKWCEEPEDNDNVVDIMPVFTLEQVALVDANNDEGDQTIALRELIDAVHTALDERGLDEEQKRKRFIALDHCRIDVCNCTNLEIFPRLQVYSCRIGDRADFRGATFGVWADFRNTTFGNRANFENTTFGFWADFMYATYGDWAGFDNATFGDRANFACATFGQGADFSGATFGHVAGFSSANFGQRADFGYASFSHGARFENAIFGQRAGFLHTTFGDNGGFERTSFYRSDFRFASFSNTSFRGTRFSRCRGLFGRDQAQLSQVKDAEWVDCRRQFKSEWIPGWIDLLPWGGVLRSIGTLKLFSVSYIAFILITIITLFAKCWNVQAEQWRDWARTTKASVEAVKDQQLMFWIGLVEKLPDITPPPHFATQMIMLGVLAFAATLFMAFCPEVIKEATETRWTKAMNQSVVVHRAASHSHFWIRHLCAACYFAGGGYTIYYIIARGYDALHYLLTLNGA